VGRHSAPQADIVAVSITNELARTSTQQSRIGTGYTYDDTVIDKNLAPPLAKGIMGSISGVG
jgi:hypothetical protein